MHQQYLNLFTKFYQKMIQKNKQSSILIHTLQRLLNYQLKEQQKIIKQRQKQGSDIKSFKSASSNHSNLTPFEKIKKLFYSNHFQTSVLFYYFINKIKKKDCDEIIKIFNKINQKIKNIDKGFTFQDKRKYNLKTKKFIQSLQFLQEKIKQERPIDWIYFQVFKEFQSQALLTAQILSSSGNTLQTKQNLKMNNHIQLFSTIKSQCFVFDYLTREIKIYGGQGQKIYIGKRSDTYFVLTQKQYQKVSMNSTNRQLLGITRRQIINNKQEQQKDEKIKDLKKYSTNKFKQQFYSQFQKLRQLYQPNTAIIASLFGFKDAIEVAKITDQINQA